MATAIVDRMKLERIIDTLFREDREEVEEFYHDIKYQRSYMDPSSSYGALKERFKRRISRNRVGMTLREISEYKSMRRSTLVSLLVSHGFLELVPYGGTQNRMMVTDEAFDGEFGHNVSPDNRIGHLEGFNRSCVFPVFYPEKLTDILWCLDYEGIKTEVLRQSGKKAKLSWLLKHHPYLPNEELAELAGYSLSGIEKIRFRVSASS
ncbi:hypothetical protein [Azospirillum doebereinerae]|uniref:Uncharacterized protein n=1 Tax=Azospirillum doebereinerae TaxID=92933 RepID=A0A3S0V8X9_9PROT|nr:hypothetical protein [Azospirillum doebereinerae]RUQ75777.1 hypothetical protein EJ913_01300 [Azospirillum doebereinerae]